MSRVYVYRSILPNVKNILFIFNHSLHSGINYAGFRIHVIPSYLEKPRVMSHLEMFHEMVSEA